MAEREIPRAGLESEASLHRCLTRCHQLLQTGHLLLPLLLNKMEEKKTGGKNWSLFLTCKCYNCWCWCGFLPFFVPTSLSESESVATLSLDFCLRKSSSLSLPFADSKKRSFSFFMIVKKRKKINLYSKRAVIQLLYNIFISRTWEYLTSCFWGPHHQSSLFPHQNNAVSLPHPLTGRSFHLHPTSHHLTGSPGLRLPHQCEGCLDQSVGCLGQTVGYQGHCAH